MLNTATMSTEEIERTGIDYLFKFAERLYIVASCIKGGSEVSEEDYEGVVKAVHYIMQDGTCPFYKTVCTETNETVTQPMLFSANPSVT
jgi:hypothetical protein